MCVCIYIYINASARNICIYIYMYIYICVCVCERMFIPIFIQICRHCLVLEDFKVSGFRAAFGVRDSRPGLSVGFRA